MLIGRMKGVVISFDVLKGFGFIKPTFEICEDGEVKTQIKSDIFIHFRDIVSDNEKGVRKLMQDEEVEFDAYKSEKGIVARNLKKGVYEARSDSQKFKLFS